jgi:hypothetical protein
LPAYLKSRNLLLDTDMDDYLRKLGQAPIPAGLAQIDDAVMSAFAQRQSEKKATSRLLSAAAILALGVGYTGGSIMPAPAHASENRFVLSETALAPSTLLNFL